MSFAIYTHPTPLRIPRRMTYALGFLLTLLTSTATFAAEVLEKGRSHELGTAPEGAGASQAWGGHPRLLVKPGDWERMRTRLQTDTIGVELLMYLNRLAEGTLTRPVITNFRNSDGDTLGMVRGCQARMVTLAMAYRMNPDPRYLERALLEMRAAAQMEEWHPAHFLDVAEMCLGLALAYDWLYDELSDEDRRLVREALITKGLDPAAPVYEHVDLEHNQPRRDLWWANVTTNWSSVCHTGEMAAALAVAEYQPERTRQVVGGAIRYLALPAHSYGPDGAYPEGPGYWNYGTTFQVLAMEMLATATGQDGGLSTVEPAFANTAQFARHMISPAGIFYNYADVSLNWYNGVSPLFGYFGQRYHQPQAIAFHRQRLHVELQQQVPASAERHRFFPYHVLWLATQPPVEVKVPSRDALFRGPAAVATFRSDWSDPEALYLGFKAGTNGVNHGHLDLGSFVFDADGVRWSSELGNDTYGLPDYFGRKRSSYLRCNNFGHSTLVMNRELQALKATAPMYRYHSTETIAGAVADLSDVHPDIAKSWHRGAWMLDRNRVVIQDDLTGLAANTILEWQMVTMAQITIAEDRRSALLTKDGKTCVVNILAPDHATFHVNALTPDSSKENQNQDFSLLVAEVRITVPGDARVIIGMRPVGGRWPTQVPNDLPDVLHH